MEPGPANGDGTPPVRVGAVRGKGRGVVAARRVAKDEVIDRAPVVVVPGEDWPSLAATVVSAYCFDWGWGARDDTAIALGVLSLCNHSYSPNAYAEIRRRDRLIELVALRDIEQGEEVTLNYNGDPDGSQPMGFHVRD